MQQHAGFVFYVLPTVRWTDWLSRSGRLHSMHLMPMIVPTKTLTGDCLFSFSYDFSATYNVHTDAI